MSYRLSFAALLLVPAAASAQTPPNDLDTHIARIQNLKAKLAAYAQASAAMAKAQKELDAAAAAFGGTGPAPNPTPPNPPPVPVDPLVAKLRAAFDADKGAVADAKQLGSLYELAAKLAADKTVPSSNALLSQVRDAGSKLIGADALPTLRGVVALELAAALGVPSDAALTDVQRAAAAALFAKLATILEGF